MSDSKPMTGPEHEAEAGRLLALAREQRRRQGCLDRARAQGRSGLAPARFVAPNAELIAEAQVHATLALLAATKEARDVIVGDIRI